jgi:ubiquinone biosynthesis protein UbiJ
MTSSAQTPGEDSRDRTAPRFAVDFFAAGERALNRGIAESTAAKDLVARLRGRSFAVHVLGTGVACALHADGERVRLDRETENVSATLRAAPIDLARLLAAGGVTGIKGTHAELSGDLQIAERFADLLRLARPDLEDLASRWIGDLPAHALGRAAHGAFGWLQRAARALRMNTAEYLQEESRALPAPLEAHAFSADVERLRDDVERFAARLARLERR